VIKKEKANHIVKQKQTSTTETSKSSCGRLGSEAEAAGG
jgi:hypothetical protein